MNMSGSYISSKQTYHIFSLEIDVIRRCVHHLPTACIRPAGPLSLTREKAALSCPVTSH